MAGRKESYGNVAWLEMMQKRFTICVSILNTGSTTTYMSKFKTWRCPHCLSNVQMSVNQDEYQNYKRLHCVYVTVYVET